MQGSQSLSLSSLLKNSLWMYVFSYLIAPLGYFTRILIARDVAMEEFGLLYTILGFVGLLAAYNGLGLTEALKYFIPKYLAEKQYNALWTTLVLSVVMQLLMSTLIFVCVRYGVDWMAEKYFHAGELAWVLRYFCWYFVGTSCLQFLSAVFLGFQDSFSTKLMEFCSAITNVFFALGIFWAGV
ncbi:MAG: oligosaccharide flippase family protein [bacterium]|nr:oligosaccharide flippase family protein [bacterium]